MQIENFSKDVKKATWRKDTGIVRTQGVDRRWLFVKISVVGFVWKSVVSVPHVWTVTSCVLEQKRFICGQWR